MNPLSPHVALDAATSYVVIADPYGVKREQHLSKNEYQKYPNQTKITGHKAEERKRNCIVILTEDITNIGKQETFVRLEDSPNVSHKPGRRG